MLSWSLALYVSEWVVRIVMLVVVTRRRRPVSAMAWLMIIFFLPWVGLALYIILGRYRLPYRRTRQHRNILFRLRQIEQRNKTSFTTVEPHYTERDKPLVKLAEKLVNMPVMGGNSAELLSDPVKTIEKIIEDINNAEKNINFLFYIYSDDETARRVTDALIEASNRGVKVRVMADAVGGRAMLNNLAGRMKDKGIDVRETLGVGNFRRHLSRIDLRNHRKLAIFDGKIAYTGSQNITDPTYGTRKLVWRDVMVRITGPAVLELQAVFSEDWYFETDQIVRGDDYFAEPQRCGDVSIQALPSGPNYPTENYQRIVVAALHSAREKVVITTPYFVPDEAFYQAIQIALLKGVHIDLIVPEKSDMPVVDLAGRAYYRDLLKMGAKIHLFKKGLLHSKTMCIDNTLSFIGSSNFDIRSFRLNFEINLIFYGTPIARELSALHEKYIQDSTILTRSKWAKRSPIKTTAQNIAKLLSPVL